MDGGSPVDLLVEVRDRFGERLEGCLYLGMEKVAWFDAGFKGRCKVDGHAVDALPVSSRGCV